MEKQELFYRLTGTENPSFLTVREKKMVNNVLEIINSLEEENDILSKDKKGMRKVLFKKWIPPVWPEGTTRGQSKVGTGCWEPDFLDEGVFHQWANNYEELGEGVGNFTVALVELPDGTVVEVLPVNLKFNDKQK